MTAELRAFVGQAVFDGDAKLDTLLAASFSFVNQPLAAHLRQDRGHRPGMARTDLNPEQRAGLLTLAPWLTLTGASDGSHPVHARQDDLRADAVRRTAAAAARRAPSPSRPPTA